MYEDPDMWVMTDKERKSNRRWIIFTLLTIVLGILIVGTLLPYLPR